MGEGHLPYCGQNCAPCHQIWEFLRHALAHFAKLCTVAHLHACILGKILLFGKMSLTNFANFHPKYTSTNILVQRNTLAHPYTPVLAQEYTCILAHCTPCILLHAKAQWTNKRTQTNSPFANFGLTIEKWEREVLKLSPRPPAWANWREAVWLNTENKAFNDAIHTSYFPPPIHTRTQQRGKLLTVFPPNSARTGHFEKLFKAQL